MSGTILKSLEDIRSVVLEVMSFQEIVDDAQCIMHNGHRVFTIARLLDTRYYHTQYLCEVTLKSINKCRR